MAKMFITKRFPQRKSDFIVSRVPKFNVFNDENLEEIVTEDIKEEEKEEEIKIEENASKDENSEKKAKKDNKKKRKNKDMITENQIASAEEQVENLVSNPVKVVKKDRGLIERAESSKIILTEDNRQVLND